MKRILLTLCSLTALLAPPAHAGAGHDHGPRHGGIVREVGGITYELVARPDVLTLHVADHGKPVAVTGVRAQLTLYAGNERSVVDLQPAGESRLTASGRFRVGVGVRAGLTVTWPGRPAVQTRFNLK